MAHYYNDSVYERDDRLVLPRHENPERNSYDYDYNHRYSQDHEYPHYTHSEQVLNRNIGEGNSPFDDGYRYRNARKTQSSEDIELQPRRSKDVRNTRSVQGHRNMPETERRWQRLRMEGSRVVPHSDSNQRTVNTTAWERPAKGCYNTSGSDDPYRSSTPYHYQKEREAPQSRRYYNEYPEEDRSYHENYSSSRKRRRRSHLEEKYPPVYRSHMDPTRFPQDSETMTSNTRIHSGEHCEYPWRPMEDHHSPSHRMDIPEEMESSIPHNHVRPCWDDVLEMLPSQIQNATGTLRHRGTLRRLSTLQHSFPDDVNTQEPMEPETPMTEADIIEALYSIREEPWPMILRRQRHSELKKKLATTAVVWAPVSSLVKRGGNTLSNIFANIDPWRRVLKRIEGKYGRSVVAVFNFLRDMIHLNLVIALLMVAGIVIPSSIWMQSSDQKYGWLTTESCTNVPPDFCSALDLKHSSNSMTSICNENYTSMVNDLRDGTSDVLELVLDFLQGTGFLELTLLFSGFYPPSVTANRNYLISLAYILSVLGVYLISLIYVVYFFSKFLRHFSRSSSTGVMVFQNIIFSGWDFSVSEKTAAKLERDIITCEVRTAFDDLDYIRRRSQYTSRDKVKLYLRRVLINLVVVALIGGGWTGIYFLVIAAGNNGNTDQIYQAFLWDYAPTVTVSSLNLIYPIIFDFVVKFEHYTGQTELLLTLGRCVLVRLTSLGILIITKLDAISKDSCNTSCSDDQYICWETHLGQQIYSIIVLDMIFQVAITFVVNVGRWGIGHVNNNLCKAVGRVEFYVPGHVLDVVYTQALCWFGVQFSPLMAAITLIVLCLLFVMKMFAVSVTCVPAERVFRASRSSAMFMSILFIAFILCILPSGYALLYMRPSLACSPFRGLGSSWEVITYYICSFGGSASWIKNVLFALDNLELSVGLLVLVFLFSVYYISLIKARGALIKRLEEKLRQTSRDKTYLAREFNRLRG